MDNVGVWSESDAGQERVFGRCGEGRGRQNSEA